MPPEQTDLTAFDEDLYLAAHPDVSVAVLTGIFPSGLVHYLEHGRAEGRVLRPPQDDPVPPYGFDEDLYLATYSDVRAAVLSGTYPSGLAHYLQHGRAEGRTYTPLQDKRAPEGFDEDLYLATHPDVRAAVLAGIFPSGLAHYLQQGRKESRILRPITGRKPALEPMAELERRIATLESALKLEQERLDWALGSLQGVESEIDAYQSVAASADYWAWLTDANPLVSVCVATVDRAEILLTRAIRSLLDQTYRNLQIVVVGDHCLDDTAQRLASARDNRIVFVNLPERGPYPPPGPDRWRVAGSNAMNEALALCEGMFVTHLDDDDVATPDRIETLVFAAKNNRADFLWHPFWGESQDGLWRRLGNGKLELGQVSTGSTFYHRYFARFPWDVRAYRLKEPGDWNRFRKIKMLRPRLHYVDHAMMYHYAEGAQPAFVSRHAERFLS